MNKLLDKALTILAALSLGAAAIVSATEKEPLAGWRYPNEADYIGDWKDFRKEIPVPFHIQADFNGDGIIDHAWILIRTKSKGWGLFVFLGQPKEVLGEYTALTLSSSMTIKRTHIRREWVSS